jgi:hypothetical protein
MISICVPFYPWHRKTPRHEEVFDVLVKGLNQVEGVESLQLCLTDAGAEDVWTRANQRRWDSKAFCRRLRKEFKGHVSYLLDKESIHRDDKGHRRFWLAMAVVKSVRRAKYDNLLIFGIDCWAPKDLIKRYNEVVEPGTAWILFPYNVPKGAPLEITGGPGRCWHTAKGIVGIKKSDYEMVGGYEGCFPLIRSKTDSNFYLRMKEKLVIVARKEEGLFHVNHNGSNASRLWELEEEDA